MPTLEMIGIDDVRAAATRIASRVHRTPVLTSRTIDARVGATLLFKCENLQRAGAFKVRGATNAVRALDDAQAAKGVATHSSGNHGAALALAARERGIAAHIVVPRNAPLVKRAAIVRYGGTVYDCEPTLTDRLATLDRVVAATRAVVVPPYDDDRVIAGAGTAALELIEEGGELDALWAPVGGGGLVSGTAIVARALLPRAAVVAAEPLAADDAARSLASGIIEPSHDPTTLADGLRTSLGVRNFAVMRHLGVRVVTASEEAIIEATRTIWQQMKLLVEPSSAVPLAAMLEHPEEVRGQRVGVVLTGGNVDLAALLPHLG